MIQGFWKEIEKHKTNTRNYTIPPPVSVRNKNNKKPKTKQKIISTNHVPTSAPKQQNVNNYDVNNDINNSQKHKQNKMNKTKKKKIETETSNKEK